jgi:CRISPR-associated protein Cst1
MSSITLYPSNWLYNAGVIGLIRVLERIEGVPTSSIGAGGGVTIDLSTTLSRSHTIEDQGEKFEIPLLALHWLLESWEQLTKKQGRSESERIKEVWGKLFNAWYRGFFNADTRYLFKASKRSKALILQLSDFLKSLLDQDVDEGKNSCSFCLRNSNFKYKNIFTSEHSKQLGASSGEKGVPNSFWNLNPDQSLHVCDFCSFVLLNHHLALTRLSDGSEIFINAPSFKVMYYLNKFAREVFGALSAEEMHSKRNILAMSVIEYATRIRATLGVWTGMNIEIVSKSKRGDQIEFFSLPYEVIQLLSDRRIAGLLSQIGEFSILNRVLAQDFSRLMETGYRLLRIGLKAYGERGKSENDFINQTLRLEKNHRNPARVAEQIFQLCALIEEKQNRRKAYEYIYGS